MALIGVMGARGARTSGAGSFVVARCSADNGHGCPQTPLPFLRSRGVLLSARLWGSPQPCEARRRRAARAVLFIAFYLSACRGRAGWSFGSSFSLSARTRLRSRCVPCEERAGRTAAQARKGRGSRAFWARPNGEEACRRDGARGLRGKPVGRRAAPSSDSTALAGAVRSGRILTDERSEEHHV
jgi:hypothetical protein